MSIEAMKIALEALEEYQAKGAPFWSCDAAADALRAAIEQAQKPHREWQGLTDDEKRLFSSWLDEKSDDAVFRAIEAKLREKNT